MRYIATFTPEAWIRNYAVEVDPQGPTTWDCTAFVDERVRAYLDECLRREGAGISADGVLDGDDVFKHDPAAPEWVQAWSGPFTIRVRQEER